MKTISYKYLVKNVCIEQKEIYRKTFGRKNIKINKINLEKAFKARLNIDWLLVRRWFYKRNAKLFFNYMKRRRKNYYTCNSFQHFNNIEYDKALRRIQRDILLNKLAK